MNKEVLFLSILSIALLFASTGCRKEKFSDNPNFKLRFSNDTVLFDTVFTTVGSATRILKIYNDNNQNIIVSNIQIATGSQSKYRMNVDGVSGYSHTQTELPAGDSLYIFVEVTLDPNDSGNPLIVEDKIIFQTNGNMQEVLLAAWGQDAYFHGSVNSFHVLPCTEIWNNDKPHVLYGIVVVDENCDLLINQGTKVYAHAKSGIWVYKGNILVNGQKDAEVVFQGDRLESSFQNLPGQWGIQVDIPIDEDDFGSPIASIVRGGIWISESPGSVINYAIIKNGGIGIQVDTLGTIGQDALVLTNTIIDNMSGYGLLAQGAKISGFNNLISNCGQACVALTVGGEYRFDYLTVANYWTRSTRQAPAFVLTNHYEVDNVTYIRPLTNTLFRNCIFYGNNAQINDFNEFVVDIKEDEFQDYQFSYCLVDTDENVSNSNPRYNEMKKNVVPPFKNPATNNFRLLNDGLNVIGDFVSPPSTDLDGNPRFQGAQPEKGCYEFVP